MSVTGLEVVQAARAWIGTPYVHQASLKGIGCDCLGLVRGVFREIHGVEPEDVPPYTPDWSEASGEERLWAAAQRHLRETTPATAQPGDILLMRMREASVAKHMGILASDERGQTVIHAYSGRGVVESALTVPWKRLVVATFSLQGS
jgi:NlpC/P60 family putative phage cell wall peptidase